MRDKAERGLIGLADRPWIQISTDVANGRSNTAWILMTIKLIAAKAVNSANAMADTFLLEGWIFFADNFARM